MGSHPQQNMKLGNFMYSLTSPYRHLYNTDTSLLWTVCLVPEKPKSYIPYLYNTDTSVKQTLGSVPLVSILKRFDCIIVVATAKKCSKKHDARAKLLFCQSKTSVPFCRSRCCHCCRCLSP